MQVLEKILEEIEAEFDRRIETQLKIMVGLNDDVYRYGYGKSLEAYQQGKLLVAEIIRKYMENDGWTPVDERVPKEEGYKVLVCSKKGNIDTGIYSPYTKQWFIGNISALGKDIIAWRPLPEPYHPERSGALTGHKSALAPKIT